MPANLPDPGPYRGGLDMVREHDSLPAGLAAIPGKDVIAGDNVYSLPPEDQERFA